MSDTEVAALIRLLDDDDERIAGQVARALVDRRDRCREVLVVTAERADPAIRLRARAVLEEIHWEDLRAEFARIGAPPRKPVDLEAGLLAIARFADPDLDAAAVRHRLDRLADDVTPCGTAGDRLDALVRRLFVEFGLRGNDDAYYDPENSYLDRVLERRLGIPISLTCVFLLVGRRLDEPVRGIGLPGHFLAGYEAPDGMRFIDAFAGGRTLTPADIDVLLRRQGLTWDPDLLRPVSDRSILIRCLNNLIGIFAGRGDSRRADALAGCRDALVAPVS